MKKVYFALTILTLTLSSCETKTQTGALIGAGGGALAGGLIGGGTGAVIGAGVGAATGALVGAALDAQDRNKLQENSPSTLQKIDTNQPLSLYDVEALSKNGLRDEVIIEQIKTTNSTFHLSADQIIELKDAGVSQNVIEYMIETGKS